MVDFGFKSLVSDELFGYYFLLCNAIAIIMWLLILITNNHTLMDKLWPILPSFYAWLFFLSLFFLNPTTNSSIKLKTDLQNLNLPCKIRLGIIVAFITLWSVRMTYIFYRRGYYKWTFEDTRWQYVKKRFTSKISLHIFNFVFMGIMQNYVLFGYSLPIWFIQTQTSAKSNLNVLDGIIITLYIIFYLIEAVADEQQWRFQTNKHKWLKDNSLPYSPDQIADFKRGFIVRGLFRYSRHPNYFGDICLWWCVYLFTISAQFTSLINKFNFFSLFNYSLLAALLMTYLFQRSSKLTEKISASKYPEYANYKSKINCILPTLPPYEPSKI